MRRVPKPAYIQHLFQDRFQEFPLVLKKLKKPISTILFHSSVFSYLLVIATQSQSGKRYVS